LLTVPTIIDEAVSDTCFLFALTSLDFLAVGGGAIKSSVGEYLVSRGVHLLNHYGATEIGAIAPICLPDKDYDWHYLRLRTDIGLELNTTGKVDQNGKILCQLTGYPFGWGAPFTIQDLLTRRTGSEHIEVAVLGRTDDLIVLANGEKFRPQQLESALAMQPGIKGAMVFGEHREEIGVIVEPSSPLVSAEEREEFLAAVWATIGNENVTLDRHARVASKDMVILLQPNKSIPRSDKGSFMRKEAYRVVETEINDVYAGAAGSTTDGTTLSSEPGKLEQGLRAMVKRCMRDRIGTSLAWTDTDDFFEMGMDSLEASRLTRMLSQVNHHDQFLALREGKVLPRFIYQNPNIKALATALQSDQIAHSSLTNPTEVLTHLAAKYAVSFNSQLLRAISGKTVLLTGATGHLGVYLLQQLCRDPSVKKVIAFNRRRRDQNFSERQSEINSKLGVFLTEDEWQKIHFYSSEQLGQPLFGLTESEFEVMARETTYVIHNAWPMDFELDLHSFHPRIKEMQHLVSFAARRHDWQSQAHPRRLIFISSIAVAAHHPQPILMEMPVLDATVPAQMGYAQAKWVCERVLTNAAASADPDNFEAVIIRLGQVVGSTTSGVWNAREHIPAILKASQLIGALPDLKGVPFSLS
jgi:nucleoside-diphosphate-sugar epimerase